MLEDLKIRRRTCKCIEIEARRGRPSMLPRALQTRTKAEDIITGSKKFLCEFWVHTDLALIPSSALVKLAELF